MKNITIAGNIGRDCEIRRTQKGDAVGGFSVAVSEGRNKETTWFDCNLWGKRAEALSQYLTKGSRVCVAGDLSTREYNGKTYLQVRVDQITLMGGGQSSGHVREHDAPQERDMSGQPELDDEIPF